MKQFCSLEPRNLPEGFDALREGEAPLVKVDETKGKIVVDFTFPGFYLSEEVQEIRGTPRIFHQVNIGATGFMAQSGKPLLPSFGRYVQIPINSDFTWTVTRGKVKEWNNVDVLPAQQQMVDAAGAKHVFEFDEQAYAKDALYPTDVVDVAGPFNIDEYHGILIHVRPLQYNPVKRQLVGYGNITLTIQVTQMKRAQTESTLPDARTGREAFGNLFINPRRGIEERLEVLPGDRPTPPFHLTGSEFLILYHDPLKAAAETLARWKITRGLATETVAISSVGNSVQQIKRFIRGRRTGFSALRYVLLLGDTAQIASETITHSGGENNLTDYYYGTPVDASATTPLVLPWISVGRLPVGTLAAATQQVEEMIRYEKRPPMDPQYYRTIVLAAFFEDDNNDGREDRRYLKTMEDIRTYLVSLGITVIPVYVTNSGHPTTYLDGTPVPQNVINAFVPAAQATQMLIDLANQGALIISHRDHGSEQGWYMPSLTQSDMPRINGQGPDVFFSVNCLTGNFGTTTPHQCFAEALLNNTSAVPALIAATRLSNTWLNDSLTKGLFDAMWGGLIPTFPTATASYPVRHNRLGDLLNYAKAYLPIAATGDPASIKDHWEIYHVLGDPTLEVWRADPLALRLQAVLRGRDLQIRLSTCPKDAVLTIWWERTLLKRIEPTSTMIHVAITEPVPHPIPIAPLEFIVACWAPGYRYVQVNPVVVPKAAVEIAEPEVV